MTNPSRHTEWLSLVEVSGPFLAVPVLEKAFPQGLDIVETPKRQRLRAAYEEWCDAVEEDDPRLSDLHCEWVRLVFMEILEYDGSTLKTDPETASAYSVTSQERTESFAADWLIVSPSDGKPRLFVSIQPPGTDFEKVGKGDMWPASLLERMTALCRAHGIRLGLITDGERWMLVNSPLGATSSDASWYARLWFQEPVTLKAFQSLWSVRRCFGPADETLEVLLERSIEHHEEITDTLGEQVRRAVEVLVQCLDMADADRNRELLRDVSPPELYEAGLTVMMRLVFVLCAEERGLLLSGDPVYDECYAVSTLRAQLAEEADRYGPEVLDRRHDAWARLLSVFRAVHGGIDHQSLRMPALGGSLFDPDRFPFLEGRPKGTNWRDFDAIPLPIDNRTVLLLLGSLQLLEQHGGALLLSYRALDVEQIGHVYEGLLEHTAARVPYVTVGLVGSKKAKNPNLTLSGLESARMEGEGTLVALVKETTERSESAIRKALARPVEEAAFGRLLSVCGGDTTLTERIRPFANLLRTDAWDDPIVYRERAFMVTLGADRRETGTHYTPKSLTEGIVETTLEPLAYVGPAEGTPSEEWRLKTPMELLDLKICDPAMGSGAFLVQACRWLADRLVEAGAAEEAAGKFVTSNGDVKEEASEADPMPTALDERLLNARRLIAERCLYGVDVNPLAVELAKLSIWLITLAKGRPFGFLDHNLRHGDSLLGIHRLDQLTKLKFDPDDGSYQQRIFGQNVAGAVAEAVEIRKRMRAIPIRDIHDIETMARLDIEARKKLEAVELVADAMIGEVLRANGNARAITSALDSLAMQAGVFLNGDVKAEATISSDARKALSVDLPVGRPQRKPLHWPLEFPEVLARENGGFDAFISNPPYLGGRKIRGALGGVFLSFLISTLFKGASANADLCAFFIRRALSVLRSKGMGGFVATSSISEGDTRLVCLEHLIQRNMSIIKAESKSVWPGRASVTFSPVWIYNGSWDGLHQIDGKVVRGINSLLFEPDEFDFHPHRLATNIELSYQGSIPLGKGFVLTPDEAQQLIQKNPRNSDVIYPYLVGKELNIDPRHEASQWIINFHDWPLDRQTAHRGYQGPVASDYQDCLEILRKRVYLERKEKGRDQAWWQFWRLRSELYSKLSNLKWALAIATQATKYVAFGKVEGRKVFSNAIAIIASDDFALAALLSSSIHEVWARKYASYNLLLLRYSPSDLFDTFSFPPLDDRLRRIGEKFYADRSKSMTERQEGLTGIYNRVHDSDDDSFDIKKLRDLQMEIDTAVTASFEWSDINLAHGFYETKQGIRFTVSEKARNEVLRRLLELNQRRHEEENRLGFHLNRLRKESSTNRGQGKKGGK
jgi:hypothetical protein